MTWLRMPWRLWRTIQNCTSLPTNSLPARNHKHSLNCDITATPEKALPSTMTVCTSWRLELCKAAIRAIARLCASGPRRIPSAWQKPCSTRLGPSSSRAPEATSSQMHLGLPRSRTSSLPQRNDTSFGAAGAKAWMSMERWGPSSWTSMETLPLQTRLGAQCSSMQAA